MCSVEPEAIISPQLIRKEGDFIRKWKEGRLEWRWSARLGMEINARILLYKTSKKPRKVEFEAINGVANDDFRQRLSNFVVS